MTDMSSSTVGRPAGPHAPRAAAARAPFTAFAAFGVFWGAWGAALPAVQSAADVSDGQLGTALLFVGLGALPSMAVTGRAVDRFGVQVAAWLLAALAAAGLLVATGARGPALLSLGMLLVGAASGAADVAINTLAADAERATGKPLLTRSHGLFSLGVVAASLATGVVLGRGFSLPAAFGVTAAVMLALALAVRRWSAAVRPHSEDPTAATPVEAGDPDREGARESTGAAPDASPRQPIVSVPLLAVGLVAALAYAIENAHQSWGAVLLTNVFSASPQVSAAAPAVFAATAAVARLALAPLTRSHPTVILIGGGALAAVGSVVLATAPTVVVGLAGLLLAALGTATLFPTLLGRALRGIDPAQQGRATSTVATTAYLGFLLGPAYVGRLADGYGLRGALVGVAGLAVAFTLSVTPVSTWASRALPTRAAAARDNETVAGVSKR